MAAKPDALDEFIDNIACRLRRDKTVDTIFHTGRIPKGYAPIRGNEAIPMELRQNLLMGMIDKRKGGVLKENTPYPSYPLADEGIRAWGAFIYNLSRDEEFIDHVADLVVKSIYQKNHGGVPA